METETKYVRGRTECEKCKQEQEIAKKEADKDLLEAAEPLHKWLCKYGNPHVSAIVSQDGIKLVFDELGFPLQPPD